MGSENNGSFINGCVHIRNSIIFIHPKKVKLKQ